MIFFRIYIILLISACWASVSIAQLSPGKLTNAHKDLEGLSNCTQCHTLGEKVSNDKCLSCHKEIQWTITQNRGLHSRKKVLNQDCFHCHSEHHGRDFEMIRFDENEFNHNQTIFNLNGSHGKIDCRDCHKPEFHDKSFKLAENSFLGLPLECKDCHNDVHSGTLTLECASCHSVKKFTPATYFDHSNTEFPLNGRHQAVDCKSCHHTMNDSPFKLFQVTAFNNCIDCHQIVHESDHTLRCTDCHNEQSFQSINSSSYNHNQVGFLLDDAHNPLECSSCHDLAVNPSSLFLGLETIENANCIACHEDVHEGTFGSDCASCHNTQSFHDVDFEADFDHDLTSFPLVGKHQQVDCKQCHIDESFLVPMVHQACTDCHADYHQGDFLTDSISVMNCAACHTEMGFSPSIYGADDHKKTNFPLTGAHLATACIFCHEGADEKWQFNKLSSECVGCHGDEHKDELSKNFDPEKKCTPCHTTSRWNIIKFDHSRTAFLLEGEHQSIECNACHKREETILFTDIPKHCAYCHEDIHLGQFADNDKIVNCNSCHQSTSWEDLVFNHDDARFALDGAHEGLDCSACHYDRMDRDSQSAILYRINKLKCADCHL